MINFRLFDPFEYEFIIESESSSEESEYEIVNLAEILLLFIIINFD